MSTLKKTLRDSTVVLITLFSVVSLIVLTSSYVQDTLTKTLDEPPNGQDRKQNFTPDVKSINISSSSSDAVYGFIPASYLETAFTLDYVRSLISSYSASTLYKRRDSTDLAKAVCKGQAIDAEVYRKKHDADTQWQTVEQLEENGWTLTDSEDQEFPEGLIGPYRALGLSTAMSRSSGNVEVVASQDEPFTNNFGEQEPTDADYWSIFNAEHDSLIAVSSYSPSFRAQNDKGTLTPFQIEKRVPNIRRWSDVVWIQWAEFAGNKAGDLKYIWRDIIVTSLTQRIMQAVMGQEGRELNLPWPGRDFTMTDVRGLALLGTPSGAGVGWLLSDHRDEIQKVIEKVRIWTAPQGEGEFHSSYYMLWFLEDP